MTFSHLIDEMPWLYPHSQNGGELFMGEYGHIDPKETPKEVLKAIIAVIHRKRILPIYNWEIQAEEQSTSSWN